MSIQPTPENAPYPASAFLKPSAKETFAAACIQAETDTDLPCRIPVHVGLFFDGTNNHMARDRYGVRVPVPLSEQGLRKARVEAKTAGQDPREVGPRPVPPRQLKPEECSHSNVARLFQAFPRDQQGSGFHPFYIQGVGTPFPEIGEPTESQAGKAFAKGGQPRIVWGLLQVLNAIHMTVYDKRPLYKDEQVGQLAQSYSDKVGRSVPGATDGSNSPLTHQQWFEPHLAKLKAALEAKPKPAIPSLTVSVFGFSRGAAEAVAFCHLFDQLLVAGKLAGIAATIRFVGLFDVVASVGGSASVAMTMPLPDALFDGHWAWANYVDNPLPGCVEKGLHLVAAHELRMNFPVTRIEGSLREVYVPGVHSDVGGGYPAGEQGKGRGSLASPLSQIPLAFMYKEALLAGVPLVPFCQLEQRDQMDFEVDARLARAWEAYTAALDGQGKLLKKHMELYYRWRAARLTTLESTASFQAASPQSQQDLREANHMLAGDLEAIRYRRDNPRPAMPSDEQRPMYGGDDSLRINQRHWIRANNYMPLDDWESFALQFFDKPQPLPPEVEAFFDDYVHDSFAGFYMAGEVTEFDKRQKAQEVMEKPPQERNKFETKVAEVTARTEEARRKKEAGEALSAEEEALLKTAEGGTPYPIMGDADVGEMRQWPILTQTATRREGGGYIIRRGYYPHSGFFLRKSKHETELLEEPSVSLTPAQKKAAAETAEAEDQKAPREFVWSDNLRVDIPKARAEEARGIPA